MSTETLYNALVELKAQHTKILNAYKKAKSDKKEYVSLRNKAIEITNQFHKVKVNFNVSLALEQIPNQYIDINLELGDWEEKQNTPTPTDDNPFEGNPFENNERNPFESLTGEGSKTKEEENPLNTNNNRENNIEITPPENMALDKEKVENIFDKVFKSPFGGKKDESPDHALDALKILEERIDHAENQAYLVKLIKSRFTGTAKAYVKNLTTVAQIKATIQTKFSGPKLDDLVTKMELVRKDKSNNFAKEIEDLADSLRIAYIGKEYSLEQAEELATKATLGVLKANFRSER
jgi:hypothetical protein